MFYVKLDTFAMLFRLLSIVSHFIFIAFIISRNIIRFIMAISRIGLGNVTYL